MPEDAIPLKYVCARWAYSELLSDQPYFGSELNSLREKLARGVPFEELDRPGYPPPKPRSRTQ